MAEGTLDLDTPEVADIFAKMALLLERGYIQASFAVTGCDNDMRLFKKGKMAIVFQGNWAAGQLLHGNRSAVGAFIPPWNKYGGRVVPVLSNEIGFAVYGTSSKAVAGRLLEFIASKGLPILQRKRHDISPFQQDTGAIVTDPEIVDYANIVSHYLAATSLYYSTLSSNALESLHGLMQDVLLRKMSPRQAARRFDGSVENEAEVHYK